MTYTLIHNPHCSSSVNGLELLRQKGVDPVIRRYMLVAERLSESELRDIAAKMNEKTSPRLFWREKDAARVGLDANASDDEIFAAMAKNPKLIQRPIGINGDKAILGRPKTQLLEII